MVERKKEFVELCKIGSSNFSDLCRKFEISRPTGYKWIERLNEEGLIGLEDKSSARHT